MIDINSELPLTMLDKNVELNDYDFVLFHLYKQYPEYREYYKQLRIDRPNRLMIFDNSAYEFYVKGEQLDEDEFCKAISDLLPDYYILPDVLMNRPATIEATARFLARYGRTYNSDLFPKPMAVAQGNSEKELRDCLLTYRTITDVSAVAIPFHNTFFKTDLRSKEFEDWYGRNHTINDDVRYASGRVEFIRSNQDILWKFKHVHLLGSHCPFEVTQYVGLPVNTIDTGYPVKCGIAGYEIGTEPQKPNIIIDDFMTSDLLDETKNLICSNIKKFKKSCL